MLASLQEHGYISSEPVEINQNLSGAMIGYELTAKGREHFKPGENVVVGTRRATEVSDYIEHDGGTVVEVIYEFEVDLNDLGEALLLDEDELEGDGEAEAGFLKSAKGYRLQYAGW